MHYNLKVKIWVDLLLPIYLSMTNTIVIGVIDWKFARAVPACEAFGPSLVTADLGALYSGKASMSEDDESLFTRAET
jgi:hypothetical protein